MSRPPRCVGRERGFLSISLMALLPVKAGMNLCRIVYSGSENCSGKISRFPHKAMYKGSICSMGLAGGNCGKFINFFDLVSHI